MFNKKYFSLFSIFIALLVSSFVLTSCEDILTGAVVSQEQTVFNVWCADGIALNVLDSCIRRSDGYDRQLVLLIANAGYGSIDSMSAVFYLEETTLSRQIPRMNLEPTDSRIFEIPLHGITGKFNMVHLSWFYSSGEQIRTCRRDLTLAYDEIRGCGE